MKDFFFLSMCCILMLAMPITILHTLLLLRAFSLYLFMYFYFSAKHDPRMAFCSITDIIVAADIYCSIVNNLNYVVFLYITDSVLIPSIKGDDTPTKGRVSVMCRTRPWICLMAWMT